MTYNYKIMPIDISKGTILWLIKLDNDQKSIVCNVRKRALIEAKNKEQKKVVHKEIFFETLEAVIIVK